MNSDHYLNDLRETVGRIREMHRKCLDACPPVDADPEAVAQWEGSFRTLRVLLLEELNPLLLSSSASCVHYRLSSFLTSLKALVATSVVVSESLTVKASSEVDLPPATGELTLTLPA